MARPHPTPKKMVGKKRPYGKGGRVKK